MYFALIATIAILVVFAIIGIKQGLVKVLFSTLAGVAIIALVLIFAPKVSPWLSENTDWDDRVYEACGSYLEEIGVVKDPNVSLTTDSITQITDAVSNIPMAGSLITELQTNAEQYLSQGITAWNTYAVQTVGNAVFTIIVYIGMFIVAGILVLVIWLILNGLSKLPVLKEINRVGGMFMGLAQGLLVIWIIMLILAIVFNNGGLPWLSEQITGNWFLNFLYTKNPLMNILFAIAGI